MKSLRVAVLLLLLAAPRRADACSGPHVTMFEMFDRATHVAIVAVRFVPERAGAVALRVERMLKGKKRAMLTARETNSSCHVGYRKGKTALVFLDAQGHTVAIGGYIETFEKLKPSLISWAAATDDVTRRGILVDAIINGTGVDDFVAREATLYLLDEPALLGKIDIDQKNQLDAVKDKQPLLPAVLQRLAAAGLSTTPEKLADLIDGGSGERDPVRISALERCERLHNKRLYPFTSYQNGVAAHFWKTLAKACRTGTPHRW